MQIVLKKIAKKYPFFKIYAYIWDTENHYYSPLKKNVMNVKTLIKQATVALNFPTVISNFILFARAIFTAMLNNPYFKASAEKVTRLGTHIEALYNAETACNTKPPTGSVDARNAALEAVKADLKSLRNDVQEAADADPDNAIAIITSASMDVKKPASHGKQQNSAENGIEEGSVELTAEGAGAHEWRMSTDEKIWTLLPSTYTSKTTVSDLTSGTIYFFQNRRMLRNKEKSEWCQSIKVRIR